MKTHYEWAGGLLMKEIIDEYNIFECDKGHRWEETKENRFADLPQPINFPIPNGDSICPFCLSELLSNLGRITIRKINKA